MTRVFVCFATLGLILAVGYRGGRWESSSSVRARALCRTESCSSCFRRACSSPCLFFTVLVLHRAGVGESLGTVSSPKAVAALQRLRGSRHGRWAPYVICEARSAAISIRGGATEEFAMPVR